MNQLEIKNKITASLDDLSMEELTLIDKFLNQFTSYLKLKNVQNKLSQSNISDNDDPLAELRNSDFIGCFSGDVDLAEQSEQIVKDIISNKNKVLLLPILASL